MCKGPLIIDIAGTSLTAADREILQHPLVGGVILFTRNYQSPQQIQQLVAELKSLRSPELLICVDQEGGRVQRFQEGFTKLPACGQFAEYYANDPEKARQAAYRSAWVMATELLSVGVDLSFAPVLDLNRKLNTVIGNRSFHNSVSGVVDLGGAYIQGMLDAGMQTVGKHFPGHGGVSADSHFDIARDEREQAIIFAEDLQVFVELIQQNKLSGIMPAHVIYPQIDPHAAGFSEYWIQDILQKKLGFQGTVFSDDITMAGAKLAGDVTQRAKAALAAGCHKVLICNNRKSAEEVIGSLEVEQDSYQDPTMPLYGKCEFSFTQLSGLDRWQEYKTEVTNYCLDSLELG